MSLSIASRESRTYCLAHQQPYRCPFDFLATNEIWDQAPRPFSSRMRVCGSSDYFDPRREAICASLKLTVVSSLMICSAIHPALLSLPEQRLNGGCVEPFDALRMWRQRLPERQNGGNLWAADAYCAQPNRSL